MKITNSYIQAANALRGKRQRNRIVAYVESYDDVLFWRNVLNEYENESRYFEVMLPTRSNLTKGKKKAIMQMLNETGGNYLIACVDADYDYLLQGTTSSSRDILNNQYIFHTYAYAIENYQCYAPSLHNVCVMATLNDHAIFDFKSYIYKFSTIIHPLFVWNIWLYRQRDFHTFSISDFNQVISLGKFSISDPEQSLERFRHKVDVKIRELRKCFSKREVEVESLSHELETLGVTPETTYMFIQGHHLFDNIVSPIIERVCRTLRNERENEIRQKACHTLQRHNELSAYANVQTDVEQMLKKNTGYTRSAPYQCLIADLNKRFGQQPAEK